MQTDKFLGGQCVAQTSTRLAALYHGHRGQRCKGGRQGAARPEERARDEKTKGEMPTVRQNIKHAGPHERGEEGHLRFDETSSTQGRKGKRKAEEGEANQQRQFDEASSTLLQAW